jgi:hypothetical protein
MRRDDAVVAAATRETSPRFSNRVLPNCYHLRRFEMLVLTPSSGTPLRHHAVGNEASVNTRWNNITGHRIQTGFELTVADLFAANS